MSNTKQNLTKTATQFLTRKELAERWKLHIESLKRREKAGILTPYKLGRGVRYGLEQVEQIEREAIAR